MRSFAQLTADEQARAVQFQRDQIQVDAELLAAAPAALQDLVEKLAQRRARAAIYLDPDDRTVRLPPT